jgi:hypothetical protein
MKMSDLKFGQIVETRDGNKYYFLNSVLLNDKGHNVVSDYNENMTMGVGFDTGFDIMKVYGTLKHERMMAHLAFVRKSDVIWERIEECPICKKKTMHYTDQSGKSVTHCSDTYCNWEMKQVR